ncbi:MAG TPA: toll/interleukin-1 receptor domain-containing protein [Anaerolineales bacterium]|nr:toll/interleukin-1 receptor domain-containing protein [Anaerolineales bacterium]
MASNRPLKIFISYAFVDKDIVGKVYSHLLALGADPWLDTEKILPGQDWKMEISNALDKADLILLCLTKRSVSKEGYVQKEMRLALDRALEMPEGNIFLIPARLEECDLPYSLKGYQWVDLHVEGGMEKLIRSLNFRAQKVGARLLSSDAIAAPEIKQKKSTPKKKPASQPSSGTVIHIHGNVTGSNIVVGDDNVTKNNSE